MKTLKCEMCGSNDIVKQEDLFVCQICGVKYSMEAAKKMMGIVTIDKSDELENLLIRAEQFFDNEDYITAREYCEKIFDINATHAGALA